MASAAHAPVVLEWRDGAASLIRELGQTSEVHLLTRSLSDALAERSPEGRSGEFLTALLAVVETSAEYLSVGRLRRANLIQ